MRMRHEDEVTTREADITTMGLWSHEATAIEKVTAVWRHSAGEGNGSCYNDGRGGGGGKVVTSYKEGKAQRSWSLAEGAGRWS